MSSRQYDAYLFDADGTLIDSYELIYQSYYALFVRLGRTPPTYEAVMRGVGLVMRDHCRLLLGADAAESELANAVTAYRDLQSDAWKKYLKIYDGVADTLRELQRRDKKLAVVTSRSLRTLAPYLQHLGIYDFFRVFVTPETTTEHKPHPAPALAALAQLNVAATDAVMVGDAAFDIECGSGAMLDTILIVREGIPPMTLQPTRIIHHFTELL